MGGNDGTAESAWAPLSHPVFRALLLALTFALGIGVAMNTPTWQAITGELVPPSELMRAVALNALPINIGRAIGPALGGILVAASGPALVFALNAASFVAVLVVVYRWRREAPRTVLPTERVIGATRAGIRYARHAPPVSRCWFGQASSSCAPARSGLYSPSSRAGTSASARWATVFCSAASVSAPSPARHSCRV